MQDAAALVINGAKAKVVNDKSFISGTISLTNGGLYIKTINHKGNFEPTQLTAALTDGAPTATEINTATGLTPSTAGAGWQCTIKDSSGSGLIYKVESDGTSWYYSVLTASV